MKLNLLALLLIPYLTMGQTSNLDISESEIVKNHIIISIGPDSLLNFIIDDNPLTRYNILENKQLFQVKGNSFHIRMKYVNPLHYQITSNSRSIDDEIFKASDKYITDAISFFSTISKGGKPGQMEVEPPKNLTFKTSDPAVFDIYVRLRTHMEGDITQDLLNTLMNINVKEAFETSMDSVRSNFQRLYNITEFLQVSKAIKINESNMVRINKKLSEVSDSILFFEEKLEKIIKDKNDFKFQYIQIGILNLKEKLEKAKNEIEEAKVKYAKVKSIFETTKATNEELIISDLKISREKSFYEVDILVKKIYFDFEKLTMSVKDEKLYTLIVRKFHRFIPSVSTGAIYSSLLFKTFGTDKNALGETIVSESVEELDPLNFGTYLNLNIQNRSEITPLIQFGVSTTKNKPALMLGLGATYRDISLSVGGLWTWTPKLNTLSVGQIVSGTTQIDDDIKYSFRDKPFLYLGVSFNILKSK